MSVPSDTLFAIAHARAVSAQLEPLTVSPSIRASIAQSMARFIVASGSNVVALVPSIMPCATT